MTRKIDNRLERQIVRLLDGQLGPRQRAELEKQLIRDPEANALRQEYENGLSCLGNEGVAGAGRFSAGKGRHGDYGDI